MACLSAVHAELVCSSRQIESSSGALDQAMAFFVAEATPATTTTSYTIGTNPRVSGALRQPTIRHQRDPERSADQATRALAPATAGRKCTRRGSKGATADAVQGGGQPAAEDTGQHQDMFKNNF